MWKLSSYKCRFYNKRKLAGVWESYGKWVLRARFLNRKNPEFTGGDKKNENVSEGNPMKIAPVTFLDV